MNEREPFISIVIPVYNGSNYLAEAIDSALAQTYANVEIIVVNDGSKDDGATAAVAKSYGDKIRYFEKENGGSSSAINFGISKMRGEWFSWLSHDDLYLPEKLQAEMDYLKALHIPEDEEPMHMLFAAYELIDASGNTIRRSKLSKEQKTQAVVENMSGNEYLVAQPRKFNFHGCSCLIHKKVFETFGVLDENLRILNDVEWWFRMYTGGIKLHYVPKVLVKGRMHAAQVGRSIGYSSKHPENDMLWKRRFMWLREHHPQNAELYALLIRDAYLSSRPSDGKAAFDYAVQIAPRKKMSLSIKAFLCRTYALLRLGAKKVYMRIKM